MCGLFVVVSVESISVNQKKPEHKTSRTRTIREYGLHEKEPRSNEFYKMFMYKSNKQGTYIPGASSGIGQENSDYCKLSHGWIITEFSEPVSWN